MTATNRIDTHGYGGYSRGCRCEVCRTAKAAYMRRRRATARTVARRYTDATGRHLAYGVTHGTVSAYEEGGCRCQPCTTAITTKRADELTRHRARGAA